MPVKLKTSILKVLVYFDLFNYPISREEIFFFLDRKVKEEDLLQDLQQLTRSGFIFRIHEFYSLHGDPARVRKRLKETGQAQPLLAIARKTSRFLFRFPYVKGIGISGSLSKNIADENADIDYFIITRSNRLWIARTIMHAFKKLSFLAGKEHWYCMNYYVDEEAMQIEEKNIFTATELITLMPMCGNGTIEKFFDANHWVELYFPNCAPKQAAYPFKPPRYSARTLIERLLNNRFGDWIEAGLMTLTASRWNRKETEQRLNAKGNRMALKAGRHYCKPNPTYFHEKILSLYHSRMAEWEHQWQEMEILQPSASFPE